MDARKKSSIEGASMRNLTRFVTHCGVACGLLIASVSLQAKVVNVQCGGSKTDPTTISAALKLLNPNVPNTLNISGNCNENVLINGFTRLTLAGKQGATVTDASGGTAQTILVLDSTDIVFRTLRVDGGLDGVQCDSFSVCRFSKVAVENGGGGIQITQSRAELDNTTIRRTQNALTSLGASSIRIDTGVTLDSNQNGIVVDGGSSLESYGAAITNNHLAGINVAEHAYLFLSSTTISGNGNGIELVSHSSIHLLDGNTITGNRQFGVYLFDLSFANFDPGNNITGNNTSGGKALDVGCFSQYTATRGALTYIGG
jgi:hypothetical protein